MKNVLIISAIAANLLISNLNAISYIKDVQYVVDTMKFDLENRNVSNAKGKPARIRNSYVAMYNLTPLIARCERDKTAKMDITDSHYSGEDDKQFVVDCPCAAKYILKTLTDYPYSAPDKGYVVIPEDAKQRLEESWINIMREGEFTYDECKFAAPAEAAPAESAPAAPAGE